ncbi:PREDICTED: dehydrodolichyl diphosphate synthase complex subunit DHDDS-like [Nicrophorus vespilloides]|uniref:Alkyl transferase n=1 Tax=Nicrophorus vespilloides TaxID=110193 RepID=A0ABM1M763_NICVS|nr:PREDICTED: dehydrodolichyl diphosphate synthase complex subunit DHDDS-like [Nicrophorus vespilloides]
MFQHITSLQSFCLNVIGMGPLPNHVALIMDGNRRYAKKLQKDTKYGHKIGFHNIPHIFHMFNSLGVKHMTVYMFSIENFKRSPVEIENIFCVTEEVLQLFLDNVVELNRIGACIRFIGNAKLIPKNLRRIFCKLYLKTKDAATSYLNIAFCYTSREEITHSINSISIGYRRNLIQDEDIDENLLTSCCYLENPKVDLLIRTSGEVRLSDYLLWQTYDAQIMFLGCTWPEFGFWQILYCMLKYQRNVSCSEAIAKKQSKLQM